MKRIPILVWNHPLSVLSAPPLKSPLSSKMLPRLYPFFKNNRKEPLGENQKSKIAADHLQAAMGAEEDGTSYLEEIVRRFS